ncbi:alpha/beta hydrolase [Chamaesiphon minutus]|uniref:Lysophospholipase n=1 Tax=Chamaesiphon minutus (strain ATCC 27169 / PCC 6605) TaxID=1173020 RepID=K9UIK6_CHAP6|nr:alpha/beta fold hydrolase [Chamaesiphon minutus]AFY94942.1 lysophospholipase [Chamaesiphon minutus PCC 6605]
MQLLKRAEFGRKYRKYLYRSILSLFIIFNILAYLGAYAMTHFVSPGQFGWGQPKPNSSSIPTDLGLKYITQRIPIGQTEWLETWFIPARSPTSKGTVILFPGNGGSKAKQLLRPARVFHTLGYNTLLVDFRGVGGSSGNTTTLGMREAEDVAASFRHTQTLQPQQPIVLYGVSMGTSAILKAVAERKVNPHAIILELPFARLVDALGSRLNETSIPTFPMAQLTLAWGSIQHGYNGFVHNPEDYASQVKCPTLILHGKLDKWTTAAQIDRIERNLQGIKQLSIFPNAGHDLLVTVDRDRWMQQIEQFLEQVKIR